MTLLTLKAIRPWIVSACVAVSGAVPALGDEVLDWNQFASEMIVTDTTVQNPGMVTRSLAMMNLAIYDSIATTSGTQSFYSYDGSVTALAGNASGQAAAIQSAYTVLSSIYGDQQATLDNYLSTSLAALGSGTQVTNGIQLGTQIGQAIIAERANDGYDAMVQYSPSNAPGSWQPDPVNPGQEAWGPAWGSVQTFALQSPGSFSPGASPALDSQAYADAYNETMLLGAYDSAARTAEQTEVGLFWAYDRLGMGTPMVLYNDILRTVAVQQGNTLQQNAEMFARATVAMADAGVVAWDSKFEYDLWRPVTGIRRGDEDGNAGTTADPGWTPLGAPDGENLIGFTPPFPTYLSGHATFGGALFGTLIEFFGTDDIAFTISSEELEHLLANPDLMALYGLDLDDSERTFASFSEAMAENGRSRVYLGIHWNYDDTVGQETGQLVAQSIAGGAFVAVPEPTSLCLLLPGLLALGRTFRRPRPA